MSTNRAGLVIGLLTLSVLAGCEGNSSDVTPTASNSQPGGLGGGGGETSTPRSTILTTPRPSLSNGGAREIDAACPYIANQDWANQEGNRVGRSVQVAATPVGCRFYFQYDPNEITGEIILQRVGSATQAFNAVVSAARGHPEFVDDKDIGDAGAISIRSPLQGRATWECIFSKGTTVVTVHTSQRDVSDNARTLARMIAPNIK